MFAAACVSFAIRARSDDAGPDVVVIRNRALPMRSLTKSDLGRIYLGRLTLWQNRGLVFVLLNREDVHQSFVQRYVGRSAVQFANHWRRMVFTGEGRAPKRLATERDVIEFVAGNTNAVGYVGAATAESLEKVERVEILE
jgi:ABC-type phosphate transport system substrate-binding protein